ncbi:MAG: probable methylmalonyl-coA epimerase [uncultured Gemmatimonadetes bacterium]|uniref:Probable methylmalonyl-coA epimerase n=1 Tax=uncultured Gemmatimonadota bacterium TaxID=203437 RepID=A0A6J4M9C0_9BACT|nr:MAG: probable methylmalonyl-coA epimerase [uncultured Gemmatimonadota bacterium]
MTERALDHVGIAVHSLDESLPVFESITGHKGHGRERVESQGVEVVFLGTGEGRLELLAPTRDDSAVARFLAKRGPGMHHLCYRVEDVAAELDRYRAAGAQLIDEAPRPGAHGHRVAFIHPKSTNGVLVELLETSGAGHGSGAGD